MLLNYAQEDEDEPAPESDRYQLVGVIAPNGGGQGFAIVSIDNQPAKSFHVGAGLEGSTTLLAVARRSADFGPSGGPSAFTLELPAPATAQTGTLPAAVSQPGVPAAAPMNRGIGGQVNAAQAQMHNPQQNQFIANHLRPPPGQRPGGFQPQGGGTPNAAGVSQPAPPGANGREAPDNSDDNSDE